MAYEKKYVVLYCYYEMVSSYFKQYKVHSEMAEKSLFMHFKDANADFQTTCEDYAIYSIENILPKFINNVNLENYEAHIRMHVPSASITISTQDFSFVVVADYDKGKPKLFYKDIKFRNNEKKE